MNQEKAEAISLGFFHALYRNIKRKPSYAVSRMKEITHTKNRASSRRKQQRNETSKHD